MLSIRFYYLGDLMKKLNKHRNYNESFYESQMSASLRSAKIYSEYLYELVKLDSVVDFGCGRGTWLHAFSLLGVKNLTGYDGFWNSQEKMIDGVIKFIGSDLNKFIDCNNRYDLAISLEVAEHLKAESADNFIDSLVNVSDTILFGAAYPGQGGTDHINEQLQSYWAEKFLLRGYMPFDVFRPKFWGRDDIEYWYRQNTFLYIKKDSLVYSIFLSKGFSPITSIDFMNCVHPEAYEISVLRSNYKYKFKKIINLFLLK